jgi:hypothetical protein
MQVRTEEVGGVADSTAAATESWTLIRRETVISVIINAALSAAFFLLLFGGDVAVDVTKLGWDFLPQTFMIALMGSLVPALLTRRHTGAAVARIVSFALLVAAVSAAIVGGAALAICHATGGFMPALTALALKVAYGACLAAFITPLVLKRWFRTWQPGPTPT